MACKHNYEHLYEVPKFLIIGYRVASKKCLPTIYDNVTFTAKDFNEMLYLCDGLIEFRVYAVDGEYMPMKQIKVEIKNAKENFQHEQDIKEYERLKLKLGKQK